MVLSYSLLELFTKIMMEFNLDKTYEEINNDFQQAITALQKFLFHATDEKMMKYLHGQIQNELKSIALLQAESMENEKLYEAIEENK